MDCAVWVLILKVQTQEVEDLSEPNGGQGVNGESGSLHKRQREDAAGDSKHGSPLWPSG